MSNSHARLRCRTAVLGLIWVIALIGGWYAMTTYAFRGAGTLQDRAVLAWPADSTLPRDGAHLTLVLFIHPKCPCTAATLAELESLGKRVALAGVAAPLLVVVPVTPADANKDWTDAPSVRRASELAMARVVVDRGGAEARRFGAEVSGTIMAFAADGRQLYAGGVTPGRGHEGPNPGSDALFSLISTGVVGGSSLPAWGCPLAIEKSPGTSRAVAGQGEQ